MKKNINITYEKLSKDEAGRLKGGFKNIKVVSNVLRESTNSTTCTNKDCTNTAPACNGNSGGGNILCFN